MRQLKSSPVMLVLRKDLDPNHSLDKLAQRLSVNKIRPSADNRSNTKVIEARRKTLIDPPCPVNGIGV